MTLQLENAPIYANPDRRGFIGGSDARTIMGTDEATLLRLWREKRGEAEPPDFSDNLLVQLGIATESLNRSCYEKTTGQAVKEVQSWIRHPVIRWMAATLDGIVEKRCSKQNSCCHGRSRKKGRPRSTWPSCSTICG